jgi:predicted flap endonuclease-1-like 5' DNA nuclease
MKAYTENLDYQGLVTVLETAKNALQEAKNQKEEVRASFKSAKKEADSKATIHAAHLKYRQAKLGRKFEILTTRAAELNLQEFVHAFNQEQKAAAKAAKKAESIAKAKTSKKVENATDAVAKPVSKEAKSKSTTKLSKQETVSVEVAKATKKETKKAVAETKVKTQAAEKAAEKVSKATKVSAKTAEKAPKVTKTTKKAANLPVVEAEKVVVVVQEAAEKPVAITPKVVVTTKKVAEKPLAQTEVALFTKTTINDLTVIEGIGPKIAQILAENKVKNFKSLIATPIEDIKTWLKANKLQFVDPTTWAEQAQLLDAGKTVEFETLKNELKGGKRV